MTWQPISTYPYTTLPQGDRWGKESLVLMPKHKTHLIIHGVPTKEFDVGPTPLVARLEANMWLSRAADDPVGDIELHIAPTHWAPIPELPE